MVWRLGMGTVQEADETNGSAQETAGVSGSGAPLRIVVTTPYCWPYVRRGTEHTAHELTRFLTQSGHQVVTVSAIEGKGRREEDEGGKRILYASHWRPVMGRLRIQPTHLFFFRSFRSALQLDADIVHSFYFFDSLAVSLARRWRKYKTVLQMNGAPIPGAYYRRFPPERWAIREALARADGRLSCSQFIRRLVMDHYGLDSHVLTPLTDVASYPLGAGPGDGRPTLLAVADFNVRRKGLRPLLAAFAIVKGRMPDVRLRISGSLSDALRNEVTQALPGRVRKDIEFLGLGKPGALAGLYGESDLTVLPSMWEPSGAVLIESWACGTPVVATDHGGLPEFVRPEVGVLFDPRTDGEEAGNEEGLAAAILQGLELSRQDSIRRRCRAHAQLFSSQQVGPRVERLYRSLLGQE